MKFLKSKNLFSLILLFVVSLSLFACTTDNSEKELLEETYATVFEGIDVLKVTEDISLPLKVGDVTITWESSNEDVLTNSGIVTRQQGDEIVELKATLTYGETTLEKTVSIVVLGLNSGNEDDTFTAIVTTPTNGTVVVNKTADITAEETVTIVVVPNTGYQLEWLKVNDVEVTVTNNVASYVVNSNITITASFVLIGGGNTDGGNTDGGNTDGGNTNGGNTDGGNTTTSDLQTIFNRYNNYEDWNFKVSYGLHYTDDNTSYTTEYCYDGNNYSLEFEDTEGNVYTDYVSYVGENLYYYYDNGDGTYTKLAEGDDGYDDNVSYLDYLELSELLASDFTYNGTAYVPTNLTTTANNVLGEYEGYTWESFALYVSNDNISKITAVLTSSSLNVEFELVFSGFGTVNITLPDADSGSTDGGDTDGGDTDGGTSAQTYTSTFTDKNLTVGSGELGYTASRNADGWDNDKGRGVQFTQKNGAVTLTSNSSLTNVSSVTVVVSTNNTTGMEVSVKVGSTSLTCGGDTTVSFKKSDGDNLSYTFTGSNLSGTVSVTLTNLASSQSMYIKSISINGSGSTGGSTGSGGSTGTTNTMTSPTFDSSKEDFRLEEAIESKNYAWNMPNSGDYDVLVVPVQFKNTTYVIDADDLADLDLAFNDRSATNGTGWESVSSYYYKSSFGALDLNFHIQEVFVTANQASYYDTTSGAEQILLEVLAKLETELDLTKYDYNNDGIIDGVYLIYSDPYSEDSDSNFWAYVTWYTGSQTFDGLEAYNYMFASFTFMDDTADVTSSVTVNASTYIHETGHMLGLDDYYDYYENQGANEGLGGADMMDYTCGDQNAYSKIMMGWITPTVVSTTNSYTIEPAESSGDCLMILLSGDGSYFSEYLLIDLYTNTGLNAMHASMNNSYLFDGATYGIRVYHVSSSFSNPYSDEYGSFTDYNNSLTSKSLIKYIEADGTTKFSNTSGWASESDLWQTGDVFSSIWGNYTRNDGKKLNFDITFTSVTATGATITVTFN